MENTQTPYEKLLVNSVVAPAALHEILDYISEMKRAMNVDSTFMRDALLREIIKEPDKFMHLEKIFGLYESKFRRIYNSILLSSAFITSYSYFENSLSTFCNYGAQYHNTKLVQKDLAGDGIEASKKFISKVLEIDLSEMAETWSEISNYRKTRNLIIHSASKFIRDTNRPPEQQELYKFLSTNPYITIEELSEGKFFINSETFINIFTTNCQTFLNYIHKQILNT